MRVSVFRLTLVADFLIGTMILSTGLYFLGTTYLAFKKRKPEGGDDSIDAFKIGAELFSAVGGNVLHEALSKHGRSDTDTASFLRNQHIETFVGHVIAEVVRQFAEEKGVGEIKKELQDLAGYIPEIWEHYPEKGQLIIGQLSGQEFVRIIADTLAEKEPETQIDAAELLSFFIWIAEESEYQYLLQSNALKYLSEDLAARLPGVLSHALSSEGKTAGPAFRTVLIRLQSQTLHDLAALRKDMIKGFDEIKTGQDDQLRYLADITVFQKKMADTLSEWTDLFDQREAHLREQTSITPEEIAAMRDRIEEDSDSIVALKSDTRDLKKSLGAVQTSLDSLIESHDGNFTLLFSTLDGIESRIKNVVVAEGEKTREVIATDGHQTRDVLGKKLDRVIGDPGFDLDAYARRLIHLYSRVPLMEISNEHTGCHAAVTRVYVPLMVRELPGLDTSKIIHSKEILDHEGREDQHETPDELKRRKEEMSDFLRSSPPRSAVELISEPSFHNFILLGEAGGGKTLLSRHLALLWAEAWIDPKRRDSAGRLAIYVELKDYARHRESGAVTSLLDYVSSKHYPVHSLNKDKLAAELDMEFAFYILDGLDEVLDAETKSKIIDEISSYSGWDAFCVVTSRIADFNAELWRNSGNWRAFRIDPLSSDDQKLFIENYHREFFPDERERAEKIDRLRTKLQQFHRLAELAGTPLLLTLICLVNRAGKIPESRSKLYEQAAALLVNNWDFYHFREKDALRRENLQPLELEEKQFILSRLAWLLMMWRPEELRVAEAIPIDSVHLSANIFPITIVQEAVRSALSQLGKPNVASYVRLVPKLLVERNSVLCPAGEGQQSFIHRTFLEYYAACAWHVENAPWLEKPRPVDMTAERRFEALFAPHWQQPSWRVILVLHCHQPEPEYAGRILGLLLAEGEKHRQRGLSEEDGPRQASEFLLHQDAVLLAAECFSEIKLRGSLPGLSNVLQKEIETLVRVETKFDIDSLELYQKNYEQRRRAVKLHGHIWSFGGEGAPWLWQLVMDQAAPESARIEGIQQLVALLRKDSRLRTFLELIVAPTEQNINVRMKAIETLGTVWGRDEALRDLLEKLASAREENSRARRRAIETLGTVWGRDEALRGLLEKLALAKEEDERVCEQAIETLGDVWGNDVELRKLLKKLALDEKNDDVVRMRAIFILGHTWGKDADLRKPLEKLALAKRAEKMMYKAAMLMLFELNAKDTELREMQRKIGSAEDKERSVRILAIETLREMWGKDPELWRLLEKLSSAEERDILLRGQAIRVLGTLWGKDEALRGLLERIVQTRNERGMARGQAIKVLGTVWGKDEALRGLLERLVQTREEDDYVRGQAIKVLGTVWGKDEALRELLETILQRKDEVDMLRNSAIDLHKHYFREAKQPSSRARDGR